MKTRKKKLSPLGIVGNTSRGFPLVQFHDRYQKSCSLQASSLAEYAEPGVSAVWLGIDDPEPKVLAREAALVGVSTEETTGWVPFQIPEQVSVNTRMHLDREQVAGLIDRLQNWLNTGQF